VTSVRYVTDTAELRERVGGPPSSGAVRKQLDHLDEAARRFLAAAPFCVLSTSAADGTCDATPRGDEPGFAQVLDDHTLVLPERPGNRRLDSLRNVLDNPHVGLLFVVPGAIHTLRINGTARLVADGDFFDELAVFGRRPAVALLVSVTECFFHCGKALVRSRLWEPDSWPDPAVVPTLGQALRGAFALTDEQVAAMDRPPARADNF
jgi:PPOX class probable FMN-dependent enzyme